MTTTMAPRRMRDVREARWEARPGVAFAIRAVALAVPLLAGVLVGYVTSRIVAPAGLGAAGLLFVLAASTVAVIVTELAARRLLPLAMLLKLSLVFPDRAPARLRVALRAGNMRKLRRWAEDEHDRGAAPDAADAAERVLSLVTALGAHDRRTRGHSERVRALCDVIGEEMRLDPDDIARLRWGGLLHDLGKLTVPSAILNKKGKPSAAEWEELRQHPIEGLRIAGPLVEWLGEHAHAIDEHHERWDGGGYPYGLRGTEISVAGRIVAVADAFECMTEVRSYQRPRSLAEARAEITACAGEQFDPGVARALSNVSLGRLHWVMGPLSWLLQVPFIGAVPRAGVELANAASAATVGTVAQMATVAALIAVPASPAVALPMAGGGTSPSAVPSLVVARTPAAAATAEGSADRVAGPARTLAGDPSDLLDLTATGDDDGPAGRAPARAAAPVAGAGEPRSAVPDHAAGGRPAAPPAVGRPALAGPPADAGPPTPPPGPPAGVPGNPGTPPGGPGGGPPPGAPGAGRPAG
jgi:HD-GYP domain-containing protein (c-di-GMP phosphodiesterase class II)